MCHWLGIVDQSAVFAQVRYLERAEKLAHKTIFEGFVAVVRSKNAPPTWSDVKTALLAFDRAGLQGLGGVDTYRIHKMMAARVTTAR
jgi:hypothetical protein